MILQSKSNSESLVCGLLERRMRMRSSRMITMTSILQRIRIIMSSYASWQGFIFCKRCIYFRDYEEFILSIEKRKELSKYFKSVEAD